MGDRARALLRAPTRKYSPGLPALPAKPFQVASVSCGAMVRIFRKSGAGLVVCTNAKSQIAGKTDDWLTRHKNSLLATRADTEFRSGESF